MNNTKPPSKTLLVQPPNESERILLEKAGITVNQSSPRLRYVIALKRKIRKLIKSARLRRDFGASSYVDEGVLEAWEFQLDSLEAKFLWREAIDLLLELLELPEAPSSLEESQPESDKRITQLSPQFIREKPAPEIQMDQRCIIFRGFLKYSGGCFHRVEERVLFEYFLMLYLYYNRAYGLKEFYRSLDDLSTQTGVGVHSIRQFLKKAVAKGFISYKLKGIPARNHYRLDIAKISASIKEVFATSPLWSPG